MREVEKEWTRMVVILDLNEKDERKLDFKFHSTFCLLSV